VPDATEPARDYDDSMVGVGLADRPRRGRGLSPKKHRMSWRNIVTCVLLRFRHV